ncbi:hypothetical protein D3C73_1403220 [compost metagenome]
MSFFPSGPKIGTVGVSTEGMLCDFSLTSPSASAIPLAAACAHFLRKASVFNRAASLSLSMKPNSIKIAGILDSRKTCTFWDFTPRSGRPFAANKLATSRFTIPAIRLDVLEAFNPTRVSLPVPPPALICSDTKKLASH